jgi:hypothetical protein
MPAAGIPRAVLGPLKPRDAGGDRRLLEGQCVESRDVAEVVEAETTRPDEAARAPFRNERQPSCRVDPRLITSLLDVGRSQSSSSPRLLSQVEMMGV